MSYDLFAHNYKVNLSPECFPYSCSAIDKFYEQVGTGSWTNFLGTSGSVPFPSPIDDYTLSPDSYSALGWDSQDFPVGQKAHVDSCDGDQSGQYFREGNSTSPVIYETVRKVGDDGLRFVIGPYGQTLTQNNTDNYMRTSFRWVWYAEQTDGTVLQQTARVYFYGVDLDEDGTDDHLRLQINWPGTAYSTAPDDFETVESQLTLAEMSAELDDLSVSGLHNYTLVETFDFAYADIFPDPSFLWVPIEIEMSLSDSFDFLRFGPPRFSARTYWAYQGNFKCKVGSETPIDISRGDFVFNSQPDVNLATKSIVQYKYDPVGAYTRNLHFYADGFVNSYIAIGGIGSVDGDFTEFRLALERNRESYVVPPACIFQ